MLILNLVDLDVGGILELKKLISFENILTVTSWMKMDMEIDSADAEQFTSFPQIRM